MKKLIAASALAVALSGPVIAETLKTAEADKTAAADGQYYTTS